jgi:TolA-binding protein
MCYLHSRKIKVQEAKRIRNNNDGIFHFIFLCLFSSFFFLSSSFFSFDIAQAAETSRKEEDTFYVAVRSFQDGFYDVALTLFDRYLKNYVDGVNRFEALLYVGECYFYQEKYILALDQFESLRKMPGAELIRDKVLFWLGEVYAKGRDYKQAAVYYKELIAGGAGSSMLLEATRSLARVYSAERNFAAAADAYRGAASLAKDPQIMEEAVFGVVDSLYQMKDYAGLKRELLAFLDKYPDAANMSRAHFYLAEANYYSGDYSQAVAMYEKCLVTASPMGEELKNLARMGLGWSYLKLKDYEKAEEVFGRFDGDDVPVAVLLGLAELALEQGVSEEALRLFAKVIDADKEEIYAPLSYYGKAEALYQGSRFDEAIIAYRVSLDKLKILTGSSGENRQLRDKIYYGLAWAYLKGGDFRSAQEMFQKVVLLTTDKIFKLSALCQLGDTYQDAREYDKAAGAYQKILEDYPESVYADYAQYQIGMTWLRAESHESAILAFRKFLKEYPHSKLSDDVHYFLGVSYFQKGDFAAARRQLEVFGRDFKDSAYRPEALFLLGETLFNAGDARQATEVFQGLIKDYPAEEALRQKAEYEIANMMSEQGNSAEAQKRFSDFIVRYPDSILTPNILFWLGQNASIQKDDEAAARFFERLVRQYPNHEYVPEAYIEIGILNRARGQDDPALRSFEKAREYGSVAVQGRALLLAGDVWREKKDAQKALDFYAQAVARGGPWGKAALVKTARLKREKKMFDAAIADFEKAITMEGAEDNAGIQWAMAETFEEQALVPEALDAYLKYHYLYPKRPDAVKALLRVAKIYEEQEAWASFKEILEKIAALPVPEARYAAEKLAELEKKGQP